MNDAPTAAPSRESSRERCAHETSPLNGRFTMPGRNCEARSFTGTIRLNTTPSARPGRVSLSGSSLVSASVKIRPSSRNAERAVFQRGKRQAEIPVTGEEQHSREQFDHHVARRNLGLALAATAAQNQPAQHRHVVVEGDRLLALRAGRTWRDHRQARAACGRYTRSESCRRPAPGRKSPMR